MKQKKRKNIIYKFFRILIRIFYRKRKFMGTENLPTEPCIIVANHAQFHGPLTCELFFPTQKSIWCTGEMMYYKQIPKYTYNAFWGNKPKCVKWIYKIASYLLVPIAFLFKSSDTLAVYRDERILSTFKNTVKKLEQGDNIIIFPENEIEHNEIINEFNLNFVDVAKLYYKKYNKCLAFVPMYNAAKIKTLVLGKPIFYDPNLSMEEQRIQICEYLQKEITNLAKSLPQHIVVPHNNINKKQYPKSK